MTECKIFGWTIHLHIYAFHNCFQSHSKKSTQMRNMNYIKKDCERQSKKSRELDTQLWKGCCREGEAGLESGR